MLNPGTAHFVKIHPDAVLPTYGSRLAACCDITLPESFTIRPREYLLIPTGLIAIPPKGWHWHIYMRSSTPIKYPGLILANCVGIIDSDYIGPKDELKLILLNQSSDMVHNVKKRTKITQMRLVQNVRPDIKELTHEQVEFKRSRGGFGSTK